MRSHTFEKLNWLYFWHLLLFSLSLSLHDQVQYLSALSTLDLVLFLSFFFFFIDVFRRVLRLLCFSFNNFYHWSHSLSYVRFVDIGKSNWCEDTWEKVLYSCWYSTEHFSSEESIQLEENLFIGFVYRSNEK